MSGGCLGISSISSIMANIFYIRVRMGIFRLSLDGPSIASNPPRLGTLDGLLLIEAGPVEVRTGFNWRGWLMSIVNPFIRGEKIHERWICDNFSFVTSQYIIKYNRMNILYIIYIICLPHCSREFSPSVVIN